jgi:predicted TIM-barrel enzyme
VVIVKRNKEVLEEIFEIDKPIIGMIHLRPLPGSPRYDSARFGMKEILKIRR